MADRSVTDSRQWRLSGGECRAGNLANDGLPGRRDFDESGV